MNEHTGLTTSTPLDEGAVPQQVPLGANDFGAAPESEFAEEIGSPAAGGKKLSGGIVVLGAVVLIAVAGLFSMRKLAEATAAIGIDSEVETRVEEFLDKINDGKTPQGESAFDPGREKVVLAVLSETYSERQVPLRDIQRDPFMLGDETIVVDKDPKEPPPDPGDDVRAQREWERQQNERIESIRAAGRDLQLSAIMGGARPLAIIGGEMLRVGEIFQVDDVSFRIASIEKSSATLIVDEPGFKIREQVVVRIER